MIIIVFNTILVTLAIKIFSNEEADRLEKEIKEVNQLVQNTLELPYYQYDEKLIIKIIDSIFISDNISKIKTNDYYPGKSYEKRKSYYNKNLDFTKKIEIKNKNEVIGEVEVTFSSFFQKKRIIEISCIFLISTLILIVIILLWGIRFSKKLTKPIISTVETIKELQNGDYSKRIKIISNDEIKDIAIAINILVDKIEEELKNRTIQNEKLENANRAKSMFLANMSHELRTPLNGIVGMLELIKCAENDEERERYIENMGISTDSLIGIVNDILDISKIETGKIELEENDFSLREIIETCCDGFAIAAHKKKIELVSYIDNNLEEILIGDKGKVRQVINNLLNNAIKFTDEGYIYINAKKIYEENNRITVEIFVEDTGIGISEEMKSEIFKAFIQGDISYSKKYQGTGLGLSISKKIVELMGGNIEVESEVGKGAKFKFNINLKKSEKEIVVLEEQVIDINKLKILVVDDNRLNREIVKKMLEEYNTKVITAKSGEEAIEIIEEENNINVVLLDVCMPGMDGVETARKLKKIEKSENCAIILFTSVDIRDSISEINSLGIIGYITKPIKRSELLYKIKEGINKLNYKNIEKNIEEIKEIEKKAVLKSLKKNRIMVVEDNDVNRETIKEILNKKGYIVDTASCSDEVFETYALNRPDIILMDIQLPGMNGIEITKKIREMEVNIERKMPIIAMTAYVYTEEANKILNSGFDDFVGKPINFKKMFEMIEKYLSF